VKAGKNFAAAHGLRFSEFFAPDYSRRNRAWITTDGLLGHRPAINSLPAFAML
jgi:hypothetical protein